jgi:cell shape-determining protein MreD
MTEIEKKNIYQEREKYRQRVFLMMLEVGVIIALPAFVALLLGKYLDKNNQTGNIYVILLLIASFVFSWAIIIIKYIKFNKKVKEIDKKIRELKENGHNPNNIK